MKDFKKEHHGGATSSVHLGSNNDDTITESVGNSSAKKGKVDQGTSTNDLLPS